MAEFPPETRIVRALPCLRCGYSLEGLKLADRCPECGTAAEASLDHLLLCEAPVLRGLRRAATRVAISSLGLPGLYVLRTLLSLLLWTAIGGTLIRDSEVVVILTLLAFPVMGCAGWIGLSRIGEADRAGSARVGLLRFRRWQSGLRVTAVIYAMGACAATAATFSAGRLGISGDAVPIFAAMLAACWSVRNVFGMRAVGTIAARAGAKRLARSARFWTVVNGANVPILLLAGLVLYPLMLVGGIGVQRRLELAASLTGMGAAAIVAMATLANAGIAIATRVVVGRIARAQRRSDEAYFVTPASAAAPLTPSPVSETIAT